MLLPLLSGSKIAVPGLNDAGKPGRLCELAGALPSRA
jgi:hypothetical protein